MMTGEIELIGKIGQLANGYQRETVVSASANIILNALRQEHETIEPALNQFEAMVANMRRALREQHFDAAGKRQDRKIIIPTRLFEPARG